MLWSWVVLVGMCNMLATPVRSYDKDMTITVQAGSNDCFYQRVELGELIQVEYQVIDASYGQLEISFQLSEPQGRVVVADYKKPENSHRQEASLAGDYRFCFDNSFSTFSTKTVFFDLVIGSESAETVDYDEDREVEIREGAENYMMRVSDILESVGRIKENVSRVRRLQELISAHEAKDRNLAEEMNVSVSRTAFAQFVVMATVGIAQILFVRNLFEERSDWLVRAMRRWCS